MALTFDLAEAVLQVESPPLQQGYHFGIASTLDSAERSDLSGSILSFHDDLTNWQGSYLGLSTTYGAQTVMDGLTGSLGFGDFSGIANTWGANNAPIENHDKTQITSDTAPNIGEGLNTGEFNPFPYPAGPPAVVLKERDATRYGKAYSHRRDQPVRIRIYRR